MHGTQLALGDGVADETPPHATHTHTQHIQRNTHMKARINIAEIIRLAGYMTTAVLIIASQILA